MSFWKGFQHGFRGFGLRIADGVNLLLLFPVYFIGICATSLIGKIFHTSFLPMKHASWFTIPKRQKADFERQF